MMVIIKTNKHPLHDLEFVHPVQRITGIKKVLHISDDSILNLKDKISKIIITGTSLQDNEFMNHINNVKWIKYKEVPVLGICAGMQILAVLYESKRVPGISIGIKETTLLKRDKLLMNIQPHNKIKIYTLHNYTIEPSDNIEVIAESDLPDIIKVKNKKQYGVSFHPEVLNEHILKAFVEHM